MAVILDNETGRPVADVATPEDIQVMRLGAMGSDLAEAIAELGRQMIERVRPPLDELVRKLSQLKIVLRIDPDEEAYRDYAVRVNWLRPQKKVSWRKLSRRQRRAAMAAWER